MFSDGHAFAFDRAYHEMRDHVLVVATHRNTAKVRHLAPAAAGGPNGQWIGGGGTADRGLSDMCRGRRSNTVKHTARRLSVAIALGGAIPLGALAQQNPAEPDEAGQAATLDYGGGTLRFGAFIVSDLQTTLFSGTTSHPLGGQVQLDRDLGVSDSLTAGRIGWEQRFNKRHGMDLEYYELSVDGHRPLERSITIRGRPIAVGVDLHSTYEERIFKVDYNFTFHDEGKVALSVSAGAHVSEFDFTTNVSGAVEQEQQSSASAPLPVLGGRLLFRITPKLSFIYNTDLFLFNDGHAEGSLADSRLLLEHRTFERFYFGGGLSRFELNLDVQDDVTTDVWTWRSIYHGAYVYFAMRFPP